MAKENIKKINYSGVDGNKKISGQSKWISGKDSGQAAVLQNCQYPEHFDYDDNDDDDDR